MSNSSKLRLSLRDGAVMAYQEWGKGGLKKVLASHGWMDNSNTHAILGPYLANKGFHVVAIDWIGHGQSSHLPQGSPYMFQKYVNIYIIRYMILYVIFIIIFYY